MRNLGAEYFHYDREGATLMGAESGIVIQPGTRVTVKLAEAAPVTGGLMLELLSLDGETVKHGPTGRGHRGRGRPAAGGPKRKLVRAKKKGDKVKKKLKRQRR